jgi:hypothetical protein
MGRKTLTPMRSGSSPPPAHASNTRSQRGARPGTSERETPTLLSDRPAKTRPEQKNSLCVSRPAATGTSLPQTTAEKGRRQLGAKGGTNQAGWPTDWPPAWRHVGARLRQTHAARGSRRRAFATGAPRRRGALSQRSELREGADRYASRQFTGVRSSPTALGIDRAAAAVTGAPKA